jgi:hypothetical protein
VQGLSSDQQQDERLQVLAGLIGSSRHDGLVPPLAN